MSARASDGCPRHLLGRHVADGAHHRRRVGARRGRRAVGVSPPEPTVPPAAPGRSRGSSRGRRASRTRSRASGPGGRCPCRARRRDRRAICAAESGAALRMGSGAADRARAQRLALEQLHDGEGERRPAGRSRGWRGCWDARARRPPGLRARSARRVRFVRREPGRQDLDRDVAPEPRVARPVHLAHPAGAERRDDLILSEPRSDHPCASTAAVSIATAARP